MSAVVQYVVQCSTVHDIPRIISKTRTPSESQSNGLALPRFGSVSRVAVLPSGESLFSASLTFAVWQTGMPLTRGAVISREARTRLFFGFWGTLAVAKFGGTLAVTPLFRFRLDALTHSVSVALSFSHCRSVILSLPPPQQQQHPSKNVHARENHEAYGTTRRWRSTFSIAECSSLAKNPASSRSPRLQHSSFNAAIATSKQPS